MPSYEDERQDRREVVGLELVTSVTIAATIRGNIAATRVCNPTIPQRRSPKKNVCTIYYLKLCVSCVNPFIVSEIKTKKWEEIIKCLPPIINDSSAIWPRLKVAFVCGGKAAERAKN